MAPTGQSRLRPSVFAVQAMRCRFEIVMSGREPAVLQAAGQEAIREIVAWDRRLNVYSHASELSRVNREAARHPVKVSAPLFELLILARSICLRTEGLFNPALGPLVRLWREAGRTGRSPSPETLRALRSRPGMEGIVLDHASRTVAFPHPATELNLNAIAKGHALDEAARLLREAGVETFALHGGTSSVRVSASSPAPEGWNIGIADPRAPDRIVHRLELRDAGLGVSSQNLQAAPVGDRVVGHVLVPASGEPVASAALAAVIAPSAATADALGTALLAGGGASANWLMEGEQALMLLPEGDGVGLVQLKPGSIPAAAS